MSIQVCKTNQAGLFFSLKTKNTEYQMKVDKYGVLQHVWYGAIIDTDMSYLLDYPGIGFSGNIYEVGNNRGYSLDTLPLEYACEGVGDHRIHAIAVSQNLGTRALDLRYKNHNIKDGKYAIKGLPAVYCDDSEAQTLEITLKDRDSDVYVTLRYGIIEKYDIITRSVLVTNQTTSAVTLEKVASLCLDLPHDTWEWVHFHGRHAMERVMERTPLIHGIQESSSNRGTSSHHQNPSVILCAPECTETNGSCIGAFFVYSGSFQTQVECDQLDQTRLIMGINPDLFEWKLNSNETFESPEAVLTYSENGFSKLSQNFHNIIRNNICRGKYKLIERPVLINNWEATYFDFDSDKILNIARQAAKLGVDMLVLDDGWFGVRNSDCSGLGDWFVNETKLQGKLSALVENIKELGMRFGLWFEPEMISEDSQLYKNHPDWAIAIPNRKPIRSRFQLVLDLSREDVREYLFERISTILHSADISYVKWDMNRSICDWYSHLLPADRQKELPHRYMLGLYDLLERITKEFPDVLFEGCSGGGGRFDAGMLYYSPQIWCSDDTDAYERTKIQYGTSFIYPISSIGSHVSIVPNHQTGRITSLTTRAITAMAGSFGYELDLNTLSEQEKKAVMVHIKKFKQYGPLIHNGDYYRLSNPLEDNVALWSFVAKDKTEVLLQGMVFRTFPNMKRKTCKLVGLNPDAYYQIQSRENFGAIYSGKALMNGGILLPGTWGDYFAVEISLKIV